MRPLGDLDHYEVLEVPRDASVETLERAYKMARATWSEGALGSYSVFDAQEVEAFRERVEEAYEVLSDAERRRAYDDALGSAADREEGEPLGIEFEPPPESAPPREEVADLAHFDSDDESAPIDGARLRRARLRRGLDLDQIAEVTKVNPTYLRFLEEDRYADLPADVYVRGFVQAYARQLGLDAARAAGEYVTRMRAAREADAERSRARRRHA